MTVRINENNYYDVDCYIKEQEELLESMNQKIIKKDNIIKKIPIRQLRDYFYRRLLKYIALRNEVFRNLRDVTRKKYPERFSTQWSETH